MSTNTENNKVPHGSSSPEKSIEMLNQKIKELETKKEELEKDLKKTEKDLSSARVKEEELSNDLKEKKKEVDKTREEKPFMPCDIKEKAIRLHNLLVCYHNCKVCFLQKKQEVSMLNDHIDLYKVQIKRKESQIKSLKDNLNVFNKKIAIHMEWEAQSGKVEKISKKADVLMHYYDDNCTREQDVPIDFSDDKENYNNFKKAKIRMDNDFLGKEGDDLYCFLRQARKRRNIMKDYDESAKYFFKTLKLASKEHKDIFEKAEKEYKASLDGAQDNYKNAMKLMGEILKSKELTKKESCCMKSTKNRERALSYEKDFYAVLDEINKLTISLQGCFIDNSFDKHCNHDRMYTLSCLKKDLEKKKKEYLKVNNLNECNLSAYDIITSWHADVPEHILDNLVKYEKAFELICELTTGKETDIPYIKTISAKKNAMDSALKSWIDSCIESCINKTPDRLDKEDVSDYAMLLEKQIVYAEKNKDERVDTVLRGAPHPDTFLGKELYKIIPKAIGERCYSPLSCSLEESKPCLTPQSSLCAFQQEAANSDCQTQQQTVRQQASCQCGANNIVQEDICAQAEAACVHIEEEAANSGCQAQQQTMQQQSPCQRK